MSAAALVATMIYHSALNSPGGIYPNLNSGNQRLQGKSAMSPNQLSAIMFSMSIYGVLCSNSPWMHVACGGLMGLLWVQSGWIGHDSEHYQEMINIKIMF